MSIRAQPPTPWGRWLIASQPDISSLSEACERVRAVASNAGLDVSAEHLRNIAYGLRRPNYELAKFLSVLTGGRVTIDQIMRPPPGCEGEAA